MLSYIEWGKFKLGDLFLIRKTSSFDADSLVSGNAYDYVTRTASNQGVLRTTGLVERGNLNEAGTWSLGLMQMTFFYRSRPWYAGQFVRKIVPKISIPRHTASFFTAVLNTIKQDLLSVLVRDVDDKFNNAFVYLPAKGDQIDFVAISRFMNVLNSNYSCILQNYINRDGLDDFNLTPEETYTLEAFNGVEWRSYRIGDLFEKVKTKKLPYKAKELPQEISGSYNLPCLTSSFNNQGLNYYAPRNGATILRDVISIPSNSDVYRAYFQPMDFTVLSDAYAIKSIVNEVELNQTQHLFLVACINAVTDLKIYSYKNKLGGWNVVKNKCIQVPTKDGRIDFEYMDKFASALRKSKLQTLAYFAQIKHFPTFC